MLTRPSVVLEPDFNRVSLTGAGRKLSFNDPCEAALVVELGHFCLAANVKFRAQLADTARLRRPADLVRFGLETVMRLSRCKLVLAALKQPPCA